MFSQFASFYGHIWRAQFKTDSFLAFAKRQWENALMRFNDATLDEGVEKCGKIFEMPPTLAQVVACCLEIQKRDDFEKSRREDALQVHKKSSPDIVNFYLNRCREILAN